MPAPDITRNISRAVELDPDIVLINLPSNNVDQGIPVTTTIAHYNEIKAVADGSGIPVFLTTTQPRNFADSGKRQLLQDEANAVRAEFGANVIDIYDELTDFGVTNNLGLKSIYDSGDGTHLNDDGHQYIFDTTSVLIAPLVPP